MQRLKELRKQRGWTLAKLSEKTHIAINTLSQYETGKREPNIDIIKSLAETFNVSTDYLLCNDLKNVAPATLGTSHIRIPVYGEIPAGIPIEMIDQSFVEDYEDIDSNLVKDGSNYFCLKVRGDSMMPKFENGDVLIIRQQPDCNSGDYCAISINCTECTFKKIIKHKNGITLQPLNPAYEPMFFSNREVEELPVTILGIVKEVRRSY